MDWSYVRDFHRMGYAVVRGVFTPAEVEALTAAFDRVHDRGMGYPSSFRDGNVFFRQAIDARIGRMLRLVQWPSYFDPTLDGVRADPRMLALLEPLIGDDIKQIINQMHWKRPGAAATEFGFHQDIRFRRPRSAYRNAQWSYVQTGIAIDPHGPANGGMTFLPGSHRMGELALSEGGNVMERMMDEAELIRLGIDPSALVSLELEPGDIALWNLFTVHGSHTNRSPLDRRFYLNGYVRADDCDRGAWTFRKGVPCALGSPVLIHYEDLHKRPEPHLVDAA